VAEVEPEPEPEPVALADDFADVVEDEILGEESAAAAAGSLNSLAQNMRVAQHDGQTIEGVLRELLRPMLKSWLDDNLPAIVDAKVEEAIDKVVRRTRI
jgi:cell pole-organizing protein PopZ